ncbi:MAG: hypothetical protein Q4F24_17675, partial [Eubacteriales bacterium]|nr:hypothetical protein [Eubacteriales bacterium]
KATSEPSTENFEASAEVKNSETETVGNVEKKIALADALNVTLTGLKTKGDYRLMLYLDVENVSKTTAISIEWTDLSLDNQTVSKDLWFADHESQKIEAGDTYEEILYIDEPPTDCKEATIQLNATSKSGETESLAFPILLSDVDAMDITPTDSESAPTEQKTVYFVEEQEVYNENGIRITIPEQNISGSVDFTIECTWEYGAGVDVSKVYVNEDLVSEQEPHPSINMFEPNKPYEWFADLGESGHDLLIASAEDTNEITFNLVVDSFYEQSEGITITIPVITKIGD